ncbi:UbiA family prenyltransferase [Mangrovivirga cuniculi]|uniref:Ubiquinone biosynthesis protein UbiA n=1 Tax=Mangrovivirga cuniculi TaxID=2715131 RepID=A0A4D7JYC7_9BACT|nr:UbiA family prenyltransferase [Mangrovivirga cuniculi]QCK13664.1 ubiquinone biosynthesis protein UbiA [Mangrovivirga cuniculi]
MDKKLVSTLLHLRFPFSLFLSPIFLLGLFVSDEINTINSVIGFIIWHLLIYPASNGFNSYYDKDEESIGGLERPPQVNKTLLIAANILDLTALLFAYFFIGIKFFLVCLIYILISRAYSYPKIRLKKYPWLSWLVVGFFQGAWVVMSVSIINNPQIPFSELIQPKILISAVIASLMLYGSYPITQIYQHKEDSKRGDNTISLTLGIKGTFIFSSILLTLAGLGLVIFLFSRDNAGYAIWVLVCTIPVQLNLAVWFWSYKKRGEKVVNFKNTMKQNTVASLLLNACFIGLLIFRQVW